MIDVVTMALSNGYTDATVLGGGAIKGSPCEVSSVQEDSNGAKITLKWEDKNGKVETQDVNIKTSDVAGKIAEKIEFAVEDSDLIINEKE